MGDETDVWFDEFPPVAGWYWRLRPDGRVDVIDVAIETNGAIGRDVWDDYTTPKLAAERGERFAGPLQPPPFVQVGTPQPRAAPPEYQSPQSTCPECQAMVGTTVVRILHDRTEWLCGACGFRWLELKAPD